jgi:3-hydroxyacyl-[acyl-carrier-protein] dehydratase
MTDHEKIMPFSLNHTELLEYQQNRYPYLMIDHVSEVVPGKYAKGHKNLSWNEWFFPPHFPGEPNMPGALQLESLAQMLTIAITTLPGHKGMTTRFVSADLKFRSEIHPGTTMMIDTEVTFWRGGIVKGRGTARIANEVAVEAEMVIALPDVLERFLPKSRKKD